MKRILYRLMLLALWPVLPVAHVVGYVLHHWGEIADTIRRDYAAWPKAFKKGERV